LFIPFSLSITSKLAKKTRFVCYLPCPHSTADLLASVSTIGTRRHGPDSLVRLARIEFRSGSDCDFVVLGELGLQKTLSAGLIGPPPATGSGRVAPIFNFINF
jgi:hypothetical protein